MAQQSPFMFNFAMPQQQTQGAGSPLEQLSQLLQMRKQQGAGQQSMDMQPMGSGLQPMQQAATPLGDAITKNLLQSNQTQLADGGNIQWSGPRQGGVDVPMDLGKMFGDSKFGQIAKLFGLF